MDWGRFTLMSYRRGMKFPTHILYVDDVFTFAKTTSRKVDLLASVLDFYVAVSG